MNEFDYVIVGSGPAGCAIAARLSEDPRTSVVMLEAGDRDRDPRIRIPSAFPALFQSRHDWGFRTAPQAELHGRSIYFPWGRVLGGSSSINTQMYIRGHRIDYDAWDVPGWDYEGVLPYFRRAERNVRGADRFHGDHGPWRVDELREPNSLSKAFVDGASSLGIPRNADFNGETLDGVGVTQVMQDRGRRWSAVDAYLRPAHGRPNLKVEVRARATRIVVSEGRARAVEYRQRDRVHTVRARREVILSAGAIGSPQLLMLSGIGPAEHLREHGIDVVLDAPEVGRNFQDHAVVPSRWTALQPITVYSALRPAHLLRFAFRRGRLTSNIGEAAAFLRSDPSLPAPDVELILATVLWPDDTLAPPDREGFSVGAIALCPSGGGRVTLGSNDPLAPAVLHPNYLAGREEVEALVHGIKVARRIVASRAFEGLRGEELTPGPAVTRTDEIEDYARRHALTAHHPVGTCRMGEDSAAVVDPQLRLRGITGLRVADNSVVPRLNRGHTAAVAMMIGERAAELIARPGARLAVDADPNEVA